MQGTRPLCARRSGLGSTQLPGMNPPQHRQGMTLSLPATELRCAQHTRNAAAEDPRRSRPLCSASPAGPVLLRTEWLRIAEHPGTGTCSDDRSAKRDYASSASSSSDLMSPYRSRA